MKKCQLRKCGKKEASNKKSLSLASQHLETKTRRMRENVIESASSRRTESSFNAWSKELFFKSLLSRDHCLASAIAPFQITWSMSVHRDWLDWLLVRIPSFAAFDVGCKLSFSVFVAYHFTISELFGKVVYVVKEDPVSKGSCSRSFIQRHCQYKGSLTKNRQKPAWSERYVSVFPESMLSHRVKD